MVLSFDQQALRRVEEMRRDAQRQMDEAQEMFDLSIDIELAIQAGEQDYITEGDAVVGFAFPRVEVPAVT